MKQIDAKQLERLEATIADTLKRDFETINIVGVHITPDVDHDGDEILRIEVVFDGKLKDHDTRIAAGAARRLRPELEKIDPDLFPLLSFVSKIDYDREHAKCDSH